MNRRLYRSIQEPIRGEMNWNERWTAPDKGLIWLWELGRQYRTEDPSRTALAEKGELVPGDWRGGVKEKLKVEKKPGTLQYLAQWQGMRGEDLDIDLDGERIIVCTRTGQAVVFSARVPRDEYDSE